ncbi:hypothetical protein QFZ24_002330 [Streptomyces phaeochromogenes]|uniref:hypothetical protein n=1 Tax=Streptomyces phaeochromogenes TaxID=1923 RepID=UPI00278E8C84|nr:hypothetical protein [Streptomyces phaeochromogenes]MDQ0948407.1 hypothetical protein [Streptomyces phaeochromogenes]
MPVRRTVRALSATALTAVALGTTVAAAANPGAEVSPRTVVPGGTVTVSVSCEPTGGPAPETIDATSQAFEHGTVQLTRTGGEEDAAGGPAYSGTARIAPAANCEEGGSDAVGKDGAAGRDDAAGKGSDWSVDGTCPAAPGGQGKQWSASFTASRDGSREGSRDDGTHDGSRDEGSHDSSPDEGSRDEGSRDDGAAVQRGVHAGEGGTFTDSTIALVTGGVLIAGAAGAAVHRLRRREPSSKG